MPSIFVRVVYKLETMRNGLWTARARRLRGRLLNMAAGPNPAPLS